MLVIQPTYRVVGFFIINITSPDFVQSSLFVTLRNKLKPSANGLTSRSVLEVFHQMQMVDVHLPTTDGRTILLQRYTEPSPEVQLLLDRLGMCLPNQPLPRIFGQDGDTM